MTYRYIGGGDWIPGVPARDLTDSEYDRHKATIEANAQAMGAPMYVADAPVDDVQDEDEDDMTGEQPVED